VRGRVIGFSLQARGFLAAPPDVVWRHLVDRDSVSSWLDGIETLTGRGDRFSTRRASEPCSAPIEGRVLQLVAAQRLRVVLRGPWRLLREIELVVELAAADGGTRIDTEATYRLTPLGRLLRPFVRLRAEIALRRASRGFRAALEDELARRRRTTARPAAGPRLPAAAVLRDQLLLQTLPD
jgi:hypothetical protein